MPFNIGPMELIVMLAIALVVLGPKKLPEVGKSLGKGMREFKDSMSSMSRKDDDDDTTQPEGLTQAARGAAHRVAFGG